MDRQVRWMFHATAMGPSYDTILEPLQRLFGCRVLHDQQMATPGIERRGGMTWIGDNSIEIGEPLGDTSPVHRFLERFGGGMHSVAVQVAGTEAALERAASFGVRVADRPLPGIAFTRPGDTAGLLFEWNDQVQADDPRWGAELPPMYTRPVVNVSQFAFVGALVSDPLADGQHLSRILGVDLTVFGEGAADVPQVGLNLGDCTLALYRVPSAAESETVWGAVHDRPRCLVAGFVVDDLARAEEALGAEGIGIRRRPMKGQALLEPAGLPFPIILTGASLGWRSEELATWRTPFSSRRDVQVTLLS